MRVPRIVTASAAGAAVLLLVACGTGGDEPPPADPAPASLRMLVDGSSAEVDALQAVVDGWADDTGVEVRVVVANDLDQQLAESFANATPPDVFALPAGSLERYADSYVEPFGTISNAADLAPVLVDAFADGGELVCVPRSADTLALAIDETRWADAGLTDADVPTTWEDLADVAARLGTDDVAGLTLDPSFDQVAAVMAQAGGVLRDGVTVTADSPEHLAALEYLEGMVQEGSLVWPQDLDADSAADAFLDGSAAMAFAGPDVLARARAAAEAAASAEPSTSADPGVGDDPESTDDAGAGDEPGASDGPESSEPPTPEDPDASPAPSTDDPAASPAVRIVPLPAGPSGAASVVETSCWGLPVDGPHPDEARELVTFLLEDAQQVDLSDAAGDVPATTTAGALVAEQDPERAPFVAALDVAVLADAGPESGSAIAAFDAGLARLGDEDSDPAGMLAQLQEDLEALQQ